MVACKNGHKDEETELIVVLLKHSVKLEINESLQAWLSLRVAYTFAEFLGHVIAETIPL